MTDYLGILQKGAVLADTHRVTLAERMKSIDASDPAMVGEEILVALAAAEMHCAAIVTLLRDHSGRLTDSQVAEIEMMREAAVQVGVVEATSAQTTVASALEEAKKNLAKAKSTP